MNKENKNKKEIIPMRKTKQIRNVIAVLLTAVLLAAMFSPSALAAETPEQQPQVAPTLPLTQGSPPVINGHGTGFIPPAMSLSHLTGQKMPAGFVSMSTVDLPSSWDWREYDNVTSVKDQGSCGSCYAFAAIANIESEMLIDDAGDYDFSENNAKECNWDELYGSGSSCSGGNYEMLANLLSQKGVVLESCDPYEDSDVDCNSTCPYQKTLLDWKIISGDVVPDTDVLKAYIHASASPVYTSLCADFPEFGDYDGSYTLYHHLPGNKPQPQPNHAVLIVGWNDSLVHDGGTGGWIVKNSWGTEWGDNGYFTIAYGSASIGKFSSFMYDWQDYDEDGGLMLYDEAGGWWTALGYGDTTAWGLCKFIPSSDTYVTRVEFWTWDATTDIDIYIYDDFDTDTKTPSNSLCSKLNLSFEEAGYHSVQLDSPLSVTIDDDVIVVVKFTNSIDTYPLALDMRGSHETGRTYYSHTGTNGSWTDMGVAYSSDVAIRLRTTSPATVTSCNSSGDEMNHFAPNQSVYVKGSGLDADTQYKIWIQDDPVKGGDTLTLVDGENPGTVLTPKDVTTDGSGAFGPTEIWAIPASASITHHEYDIVVDKQGEGSNTGKLNFASDGIDSVGVVGFVAPVPELPTIIQLSIGLFMLAGYVVLRRKDK